MPGNSTAMTRQPGLFRANRRAADSADLTSPGRTIRFAPSPEIHNLTCPPWMVTKCGRGAGPVSSCSKIGLLDARILEQGRSLVFKHDPAGLDEVTTVGQPQRQVHALLDKQDRDAVFIEAAYCIGKLIDKDRGEAKRRFVQHQALRVRHDAAGDRQHLLLTTG